MYVFRSYALRYIRVPEQKDLGVIKKKLKGGLRLGGVSLVEVEVKKVEKDLAESRVEEKKVTEGRVEEKEKLTRGRSVLLRLSNSLNSLRAETKRRRDRRKIRRGRGKEE